MCSACAERASPELTGQVFDGQWRLGAPLGRGGMSTVYAARDLVLGRAVAVKVLAPDFCHDDAYRRRFRREAELTAQLEHPNIVPVLSVGEHGGVPFLVMKHLEGMTLAHYARALPSRISPNELLALMKQACDGLDFIHGRGFVHRDIKPSNLFVGPDGRLTILDLGIVKGSKPSDVTTTLALVGTPQFMSPEQRKGDAVDARSDLYSLGLVIAELWRAETPPLPEEPPLEQAMRDFLRRALAHDPVDRFQTARELSAALEQALRPPMTVASGLRTRTKWGIGALVLVSALGVSLSVILRREQPPGVARISLSGPMAVPAAKATVAAPAPPEPAPGTAPAAPLHNRVERPTGSHRQRPAETRPSAPAPGRLTVVTADANGPTWASVFVDGAIKGGTPLSLDVPPGPHRVRVEREGFAKVERAVSVRPGETTALRIQLAP